ncbi:hypothetical protein HMPREF9720_1485 [Alistipes sp. HGB5]|nr:hypothetical protein HMPREF9720_1485 [Alistipes sp. HGB5]
MYCQESYNMNSIVRVAKDRHYNRNICIYLQIFRCRCISALWAGLIR